MFGFFSKKNKQPTGAELAEEGLRQISIAINNNSISLEQGRIFDDIYVHADKPLDVPRTAYVMFSPSVQNQVIARCVLLYDGVKNNTPSFQIDWAVLPEYRGKNWGKTIAAKAIKEFTSGLGKVLPMGFYIEAIVDADNEPSIRIAQLLLGGEEVLLNKQTGKNVHSFLKKFPGKNDNVTRPTPTPLNDLEKIHKTKQEWLKINPFLSDEEAQKLAENPPEKGKMKSHSFHSTDDYPL